MGSRRTVGKGMEFLKPLTTIAPFKFRVFLLEERIHQNTSRCKLPFSSTLQLITLTEKSHNPLLILDSSAHVFPTPMVRNDEVAFSSATQPDPAGRNGLLSLPAHGFQRRIAHLLSCERIGLPFRERSLSKLWRMTGERNRETFIDKFISIESSVKHFFFDQLKNFWNSIGNGPLPQRYCRCVPSR
jgi:hypothetical protein